MPVVTRDSDDHFWFIFFAPGGRASGKPPEHCPHQHFGKYQQAGVIADQSFLRFGSQQRGKQFAGFGKAQNTAGIVADVKTAFGDDIIFRYDGQKLIGQIKIIIAGLAPFDVQLQIQAFEGTIARLQVFQIFHTIFNLRLYQSLSPLLTRALNFVNPVVISDHVIALLVTSGLTPAFWPPVRQNVQRNGRRSVPPRRKKHPGNCLRDDKRRSRSRCLRLRGHRCSCMFQIVSILHSISSPSQDGLACVFSIADKNGFNHACRPAAFRSASIRS